MSSCSRNLKVIHTTSSTGASVEPGHGLEIQPQLANVIWHLLDSVGTCSSTGRCVGTWIVRVSDVGCICGDAGAASWGCDDTAHSESSSTVSIRWATLGCALWAGVTGAIGGGGAGGCALLVGELDNGEQGESLWIEMSYNVILYKWIANDDLLPSLSGALSELQMLVAARTPRITTEALMLPDLRLY